VRSIYTASRILYVFYVREIAMAVADDVKTLAAQDVLYLSHAQEYQVAGLAGSPESPTPFTTVYRGRLRQALNGDWVFNTSTGQNGTIEFLLGPVWARYQQPGGLRTIRRLPV
jgi:hypothetical protein